MKLETAAFGYLRERLHSEQRVVGNDLWLSATCAVLVPASDGLMFFQILAGVFVPLISHRDAMFHPDEDPERGVVTHTQHSGTIPESARLIQGIIAMKTKSLAAIAIDVLAACTGLTVNSFRSLSPEKQSTSAATQVADRLALSADPFLMRSGG